MAYNTDLAEKLRKYLKDNTNLIIHEIPMFGGLAFMVDGKMCINISGENLMCRFNPKLEEEISARKGYKKMIMNGRKYRGYCYVLPELRRKKRL